MKLLIFPTKHTLGLFDLFDLCNAQKVRIRIITLVYVHSNTVLNAFLNSLDSFISLGVPPFGYDSCSFKIIPR